MRALFNDVSKSATVETKKKGVNHINTEGDLGILNKMKKSNGKVFHLKKKHWVPLEKGDGRENGVYYNARVMTNISNYVGAVYVLQLLQDISKSAFNKVFHGKGSVAS